MTVKKRVKKQSTKPSERVKDKKLCYAYISEDNMNYVKSLQEATRNSLSVCLDKVIEAVRLDIELSIPCHIPKSVLHAQEVIEKAKKEGYLESDSRES